MSFSILFAPLPACTDMKNCVDRWWRASIVAWTHFHPIPLGFAVHSFTRPLSEFYGFCESLQGTAVALAARNADLSEIKYPVPGSAEQEEH